MACPRSGLIRSSWRNVLSGKVTVTGRLGSLNLGGRPPGFRFGIGKEAGNPMRVKQSPEAKFFDRVAQRVDESVLLSNAMPRE